MSDPKPPCGNEDCDKCYPLPRFKIVTERVQRLFHERTIKAATADDALRIYNGGTAWPSSYDDRDGEILEEHAPRVEQLPPDSSRYSRECFHDLPAAEVQAFLRRGDDDDFALPETPKTKDALDP